MRASKPFRHNWGGFFFQYKCFHVCIKYIFCFLYCFCATLGVMETQLLKQHHFSYPVMHSFLLWGGSPKQTCSFSSVAFHNIMWPNSQTLCPALHLNIMLQHLIIVGRVTLVQLYIHWCAEVFECVVSFSIAVMWEGVLYEWEAPYFPLNKCDVLMIFPTLKDL